MVQVTRSPLDVVRAFMTAVEQKDYDTALRFLSDDCEYTNLPLATVRGPAAVRGVLEPFFAPTLENEFVVLRAASDGPLVFTERLDRHRLTSGSVELPVTGVWEVRDGHIEVWREYFDAATLLKAWPAPTA
jgi:limonene-1,2-epoxide hydrolase